MKTWGRVKMAKGGLILWGDWQRAASSFAVVESAGEFPRTSGIACPNVQEMFGLRLRSGERCAANLIDTRFLFRHEDMERRLARCEVCGFKGCKLTGREGLNELHPRRCACPPTRTNIVIPCGTLLERVWFCENCGEFWCRQEFPGGSA